MFLKLSKKNQTSRKKNSAVLSKLHSMSPFERFGVIKKTCICQSDLANSGEKKPIETKIFFRNLNHDGK